MRRDTRTALLDAAEDAARSRGFDGFSYADLSKDVGIRKASIHHHFPSKADLAIALMHRYHLDMQEACARIDKEASRGGDRLAALIDHYRKALDQGRCLCLCVSFSTSRESLPPDAVALIAVFRADVVAWLATTFTLGAADGSIASVADPGSEAAAALSLLEGAQLAARAAEDPRLFDGAVHLLSRRCRLSAGV